MSRTGRVYSRIGVTNAEGESLVGEEKKKTPTTHRHTGLWTVGIIAIVVAAAALIVGAIALGFVNAGRIGYIADLLVGNFHATGNGQIDGALVVGGGITSKNSAHHKRDDMAMSVAGASLFTGEIIGESQMTLGTESQTVRRADGRMPPEFNVVKLKVFGSAEIGGTVTAAAANVTQLTVTSNIDISKARIKTAPNVIIVGSPIPGVNSFPSTIPPLTRKIRERKPRSTGRVTKDVPALTPLVPTLFSTYMQTPGSYVPVPTIGDALSLLHGKNVYNTTILVHPGTYNEDVILGGFSSDCFGGTEINSDGTRQVCTGLVMIGDTRRTVGRPYVQGSARENYYAFLAPYGGGDSTLVTLTCLSPTQVQVTLTDTDWTYYVGTPVDFEAMLVVPGDKMTLWNAGADVFSEKTITAVSGNTLTFAEAGCNLSTVGSSLLLQPNRVIQCQGEDTSDYQSLSVCLNIMQDISINGFRVKAPTGTRQVRDIISFRAGQIVAQSVVADGSTGISGTNFLNAFFATGSLTKSLYTANRENANHNFVFGVQADANGHIWNEMTALNGRCLFSAWADGAFLTVNALGGQSRIDVSYANVKIEQAIVSTVRPYGINIVGGRLTGFYSNIFGPTSTGIQMSIAGYYNTDFRFHRIVTTGSTCILADEHSVIDMGSYYDYDLGYDYKGLLSGCATGIQLSQGSQLYHINLDPTKPQLVGVTKYIDQDDASTYVLNNNVVIPAQDVTANGAINPNWRVQHLAGAGPRVMTLSSTELTNMLNKEYAIYSLSAAAHTITLTGGAQWSSGKTTATFPATIGAGLTFRVLSSTVIAVTSNSLDPVVFSP